MLRVLPWRLRGWVLRTRPARLFRRSSVAALAKQLMGDLGPWGVVALRLLTSSILLWVFFRPQIRSWTRQQWMAVIVLGVALTGANAFFYVAIEQVPLAIAVAIEFMGPLVLATVMSRR